MRTSLLVAALCASPGAGFAPAQVTYTISTIAGAGDCGDGGPAARARIGAPEGLAVDRAGNVYIADALDHRVRKVTPSGTVTTIAGSGRVGFRGDGGPATKARLNAPYGLAVDAAGNLYICDLGNARVRKVSPDGVIHTVAGGGSGLPDATGVRLIQPRNIALDPAGNVYFSDFADHAVYRLAPHGAIARIAGAGRPGSIKDGVAVDAATAPLRSPAGLAIDRSGALYIADSGNHRVRKLENGLLTTVSSAAPLDTPAGIALDAAGDLYVADKGMSAVWKLTPAARRFAGTGAADSSGDGGPAALARFNQPREIAFDGEGNLYIADTTSWAGVVRRVTPAGTVAAFAGGEPIRPPGDDGPASSAYLDAPSGLAVDGAGSLYIADRAAHRIRRIVAGVITTVAGIGFAGSGGDGGFASRAQIEEPESLAPDASGNLWFTEPGAKRVRKIDTAGYISTLQVNALIFPAGVAVDDKGNTYIADSSSHLVRRITPDGADSVFAGTGLPGYAGDRGPAVAALLRNPAALCLDRQGNLYIADSGNHAIRKVSPDGVITTFAGRGDSWFGGDGGPAAGAWLNSPAAVAADAHGNLYIADTGNQRVRKVNAEGVIETIAGTGARGYSGDGGPAPDAELDEPAGVAVDAAGVVYVSDRGNGVVRRLTPVAPPPPVIDPLPVTEEPELGVTSLVNAASMLPGAVAPGEIATIYGTALGAAQVFFEAEPAALLFAGENQINLVVPRAVSGRASAEVEVRSATDSLRLIVPVADANPGIFTLSADRAAALNEGGQRNSDSDPAPRGTVLTFFATGEGDGVPLTVEIGGEPAPVLSAEHTAGLLRITARVPNSCAPGKQTIVLTAGTVSSQPGVFVFVR